MEKARQEYKRITGSEPKNLVMLGDETGRKFAEQFAALAADLGYDSSSREIEFIKVKRTKEGYFVRLIDVHKKDDGKYSGVTLDIDHALLEEVGPAIRSLNIGDSATYCIKGKDISEIIRKRASYFYGREQPSVVEGVKTILSKENLTEKELRREHTFEIRGNDSDGYIADVKVKNQYGIHARPSSMIIKTASKYDCNIFIKKNGRAISAKSIMALLTLEASKGSDLILETEGRDAKKCLEEIVKLFETNFGED